MVRPGKWRITQWLVVIVVIAYMILLAVSPWYYNIVFSIEMRTEKEQQKEQQELEELENEEGRMPVEAFHIDDQGNRYNEDGDLINLYGDILEGEGQLMPDGGMLSDPDTEELPVETESGVIPIELREPERQLSFRETMILRREGNVELEREGTRRAYKDGGDFGFIDYLFISGILLTVTYGFGLFLSKGSTLLKLAMFPGLVLAGKTAYILKSREVYILNPVNVLNWWIGFIIFIIAMVINHTNIIFICKEED